jgi:hypothetical protein
MIYVPAALIVGGILMVAFTLPDGHKSATPPRGGAR